MLTKSEASCECYCWLACQASCWRKLVTDYWLLQFACCNTCNNDNQSSLAPLTLKSLLQLGHIFQFYNAFCFTMLIDVQYQFLIASTNDDTQRSDVPLTDDCLWIKTPTIIILKNIFSIGDMVEYKKVLSRPTSARIVFGFSLLPF
ncbi:hypothetical protein T4B_15569 [Trichinella pseudospiralis]|uniref:Uncharacterized protein n=1 Tax=Trichinella pseudospiralis TaxID=6337 RepID=A0A0V1J3F6_TRIPS|nr:hypothetical protein T4B_15569 [Trichinella pseudospiralis]